MKILLVAATHFEIKKIIQSFVETKQSSNNFTSYQYNNHQIDVLITGVGMVFTTYHLTKILQKNTYDFSLNIGLAGTFSSNIKIGEVVNVTHDCFSELGAEDDLNWLGIADMGLISGNDWPYLSQGITNTTSITNFPITELPLVRGITVNTVHGNNKSISNVMINFCPEIETMEGASFLFCCLAENIPCAQIRGISNKVEKRNKDAWNLPLALTNLNVTVLNILKHF